MLLEARRLIDARRSLSEGARTKVNRNDFLRPAPSPDPERQHVDSAAAQLTEALRRRDAGNDFR